jgi:hypothetical protein
MTDIEQVAEKAWPKSASDSLLPYKSWERLAGESSRAYEAFCAFRDFGPERNIRIAVESAPKSDGKAVSGKQKSYGVWRTWAAKFRWQERAADYDRHIEKQKQEELRKTIEAQGEMHRKVTGKMLDVVCKKLDTMNPEELTQGNLTEWVQTAIKAEREAAGLVSPNGKPETKQGELNFTPDFQGL